jgi:hypothetical protein
MGDGSCEVSMFLAMKSVESSNVEISTRGFSYHKGLQLSQGGRSGEDVVGYVQRPWGVHIDMVRNRGSKGMDRCPLTKAGHESRKLMSIHELIHGKTNGYSHPQI